MLVARLHAAGKEAADGRSAVGRMFLAGIGLAGLP